VLFLFGCGAPEQYILVRHANGLSDMKICGEGTTLGEVTTLIEARELGMQAMKILVML
jgi:hypothetical protein